MKQHWFFKYKLYHIPFWCLYQYIWWTVAFGNPLKAAENIALLPYSVKYIFYVLFEALAVYFNLYYLIPKFLERKKYVVYSVYLTLTMLAASLLIVAGYYTSSHISGKSLNELYGNGSNCFYYFFGYALPSVFAAMMLAMTIKLVKNKIQQDRRQQMAEKEKLETELKFLKEQFNPHFLFNSINSIFVLIRRNPELASSALVKFSDLLRHQLYDCNVPQISLSSEIHYLENYIGLEKLRQSANLKVIFTKTTEPMEHLGIAPFILMTFVENAFKHVLKDPDIKCSIRIQLTLEGNQLRFQVSNTIRESSADTVSYKHGVGGIGLKNVRRRLELLYPGEYLLVIKESPGQYEVCLDITLQEMLPAQAADLFIPNGVIL